MGIKQRRHTRYPVHLVIRYANAAEFVGEYVENLSLGGLFVAAARDLDMLNEIEIEIDLPGHGVWKVRAKPVFILDVAAATATGRRAGAGMEITYKPAGFDDALFGYLVRLGRRRDAAVMVDDVVVSERIAEAGYRLVALEGVNAFVAEIARAIVPIIAVVVPPPLFAAYSARARDAGFDAVFAVGNADELADIVARIDGLL